MNKTHLPSRSKKRIAEDGVRRAMKLILFEKYPICQRCQQQPSQDAHEILSRARGGSITDPENIAMLCRPCHSYITTEPLLAQSEGWTRSAIWGPPDPT